MVAGNSAPLALLRQRHRREQYAVRRALMSRADEQDIVERACRANMPPDNLRQTGYHSLNLSTFSARAGQKRRLGGSAAVASGPYRRCGQRSICKIPGAIRRVSNHVAAISEHSLASARRLAKCACRRTTPRCQEIRTRPYQPIKPDRT